MLYNFPPVSPFSSFSCLLSPYLPDIAEARVLQVMFSVRSSEKLSKKRRVEKKHPALKLDRNKGVVLWQDITAISVRRPWSLQSCHSLGDVVANKKVCELCSPVGGFHKTNNHINKTQQILGKVSPS